MNTAPATVTETATILVNELGTRTGLAHDVLTVEDYGNVWNILVPRFDGNWILTEDSILCWYPGGTWSEDGSEPEFETQIDCTTPRYLAEAAADIITAPADQRAYVAAINGPNLVQG
jgi:hypothetical protein